MHPHRQIILIMEKKEQSTNQNRIMLTVSYDGTNYSGWAYQENVPTIEGALNAAIKELTGEELQVIGASRTDAGVHAYGNLAVFDTKSTIPPDRFMYALNPHLPKDIRIVKSQKVAPDFHPRHCDTIKTYEYHVLNTDYEVPVKRNYTYHFGMKLDIDKMNQAAKNFEGEHDFTSFCNVESQALTHVRTVYEVNVRREQEEVIITVKGAGFLYNMVRIMSGTLLQIGRGKGEPSDIKTMLEAKDRTKSGPTAPAQGLFLIQYEFPSGIPA